MKMKTLLKKIWESKFTPKDWLCLINIHGTAIVTGGVGTLVFYFKAWLFGIDLGKGCKCYGRIHIMRGPRSVIRIGNSSNVVSSSKRCTAGSLYAPTKLRTFGATARILIGANVGLNGTSIVARTKTISIGDNVMIAPNVTIMDSDFHALHPPEMRTVSPGFENDRDVVVEDNVWVGSRVMILKGVTIGMNSVIAAGSVVTRDIPANVIAGGVPARVIREF